MGKMKKVKFANSVGPDEAAHYDIIWANNFFYLILQMSILSSPFYGALRVKKK